MNLPTCSVPLLPPPRDQDLAYWWLLTEPAPNHIKDVCVIKVSQCWFEQATKVIFNTDIQGNEYIWKMFKITKTRKENFITLFTSLLNTRGFTWSPRTWYCHLVPNIGSKRGSLKVVTHSHTTHIHMSTSLRTKDLFSARIEGSGLGRPFDVGTLRSEMRLCVALNSIPHNSSFFTLLLAWIFKTIKKKIKRI